MAFGRQVRQSRRLRSIRAIGVIRGKTGLSSCHAAATVKEM